jgi:outer membrane protein
MKRLRSLAAHSVLAAGAALAIGLGASPLWLAQPPALADDVLTLNEAISIGLAHNPQVQQARSEIEKAGLSLADAQSQRLQYTGDLSLGDRQGVMGLLSSQSLVAANTPVANGTVMATVPLFTGFKISNQISQAEAGGVLASAKADQARQEAVWQITEAYWQARRAELHARIQNEATNQARQARQVVKASFDIGRASAQELDRAEVTLLNNESDLLKSSGEQELARDQLATLLQQDISQLRLADPPAIVEAGIGPAVSLEQALSEAMANRPTVRMAKAQVAIAQAGVEVAKADRWPQLSFVTAYQHGNNPFIATSQNRDVLNTFVGTWDARLNMGFHLFDNGVINRNVARSEADVAASQQALEAARRQTELEIRQAHRRMSLARRRVMLGEKSEQLAAKNLTWIEGRFKFGYALLVELNEARVNLISSRNQRADAQIDYQLAEAALKKAMGKLEAPDNEVAGPRPAVQGRL